MTLGPHDITDQQRAFLEHSDDLERAIRDSDALKGQAFDMTGLRQFFAVPGQPVVGVRQMDTLSRRHTNFIKLDVSPGIDGVQMAKAIAEALALSESRTCKPMRTIP